MMRVEVLESEGEVARRAAGLVRAALAARPGCVLGLASGKTPLGMYEELARREAVLSDATVFAIDELYGVPRSHPATNASYFRARLPGPVRVLHLLDSEAADAEAECARFSRLIEEAGGLDLVVVGIGVNGHVAFNEPGAAFDSRARLAELAPSSREAYARQFGSLDATPRFGLTLGIADLVAARAVLLLALGTAKAEAIARAI
ncbi:MAG: 6-phosphogluconolactonase, partial [Chloroflexi bacterium]|nr:6-phosphogluconolactonase [Chloroflexota bacterium]